MQYSDDFLDLTAPHLSQLGSCNAPEVREPPDYARSLAMRQTFGAKRYKDANVVVYLARFATRLSVAAREYIHGREQLLRYVGGLPQHNALAAHGRAVSHFESCVLNAHLAATSLEGAAKVLAPSASFGKTDDYDRLRLLNNRIKHFAEDVAVAAKAGTTAPAAPLWLTDDSIVCARAGLEYTELANLLQVHITDAKEFCEEWLK